MTLGKWLILSAPQFICLNNGSDSSDHISGLPGVFTIRGQRGPYTLCTKGSSLVTISLTSVLRCAPEGHSAPEQGTIGTIHSSP